mgnify:CR=1 FL=1
MKKCEWLHNKLETLPLIQYPFQLEKLPINGIYFFYETNEIIQNNKNSGKIVRIGTHKGDNFRSRISDHYLFNERKMYFDAMRPAPKDRSIFRKNIGRVLLNRDNDNYLDVWNIDFTEREKREKFGHLRDIDKEKKLEKNITHILRNDFSFRFVIIKDQDDRMGDKGLEKALIGTVANCSCCGPSDSWFGRHSPEKKIRESGLWQVHYLNADVINENQKQMIGDAIEKTKIWSER